MGSWRPPEWRRSNRARRSDRSLRVAPSSRMVVLHGQRRRRGRPALRLSADVFPRRRGSRAGESVAMGGAGSVYGASRADGCERPPLSLQRSHEPRGAGLGGRAHGGLSRVERRLGGDALSAAHAPAARGHARVRHRSHAGRGPAARAQRRSRLQREGIRGGQRVLLLLAHAHADARGDHDRRPIDPDHRRKLDGSRVRHEFPRDRAGRLGLVLDPARRRPRSDDRSAPARRRLDRSRTRAAHSSMPTAA